MSALETLQIPFVGLDRQHAELRPELLEALASVLDGGSFILGDDVEAFECEWAEYCEARFAVGVASGTAAIHLTLEALGIGPGDEVIAPANTFVATVLPVLQLGARPVLVDCDPVTAMIDLDAVAEAVTPRTKAVLPVHLYGQPADLAPLLELADKHGFDVVEDACQAHGARYRGRRVGGIGRAACFSFYPSKNLGTIGDGGAIVTNDERLAAALREKRDLGQRRKYEHVVAGYNERLDTLHAAVLRVKLPHLDRWNAARAALADVYGRCLEDVELQLPALAPEREHVWHLYVVRTRERDRARAALAEAGIATGLHYPVPVHLQPAFRSLGYAEGSFPAAEAWSREGLSLPMFPELHGDEAVRVAGELTRALA